MNNIIKIATYKEYQIYLNTFNGLFTTTINENVIENFNLLQLYNSIDLILDPSKINVITFNNTTYEVLKAKLINAQLIFESNIIIPIFEFPGVFYKDTSENLKILNRIQRMTKAINILQTKQNNLQMTLKEYNLI